MLLYRSQRCPVQGSGANASLAGKAIDYLVMVVLGLL
jgi:hypothetical protein